MAVNNCHDTIAFMELTILYQKIRKLEKLKKVLSDPDVQEVLADPELVALIESLNKRDPKTATNGSRDTAPPPPGTLLGETLSAASTYAAPFSAKEIVATMQAKGFNFQSETPQIAVNGALRPLQQRG